MDTNHRYKMIIDTPSNIPTELIRMEYYLDTVIIPQVEALDGNNIQCNLSSDKTHWFFIRDLALGLPPNIKSIKDIVLCTNLTIYEDKEKIIEKGNCFIVDSSLTDSSIIMELTYTPLGFIKPITQNIVVNTFNHIKDNEVILEVNTDTEELFFIRDKVPNIEVRYPYHNAIKIDLVSIKDIFYNEVMYGTNLILLKPKVSNLPEYKHSGIQI